MTAFKGLCRRNMKIYFGDRLSVFFSMMTPIIIFLLYLFFLKGTFLDSIRDASQGLEGLIDDADTETLVNAYLLSGVLGSSVITVSLHTLLTVIRDRENKIDYDVSTTPMSRVSIIFAYYCASLAPSFLLSGIILSAGLLILSLGGSLYLGFCDVLLLYGTVLLGALSATSLFMLPVLFLKSSSAASALMTLVSVCAGFVIGAYIPVSEFAPTVRTFCNLFPGSGVTVLLRQTLLGGVVGHIDAGIGGADGGAFVQSIREIFGFRLCWGGTNLSGLQTAGYVLGLFALSLLGIALIYPKVSKRK